MNFIAAILLIGAIGSASRSMETDASIGRIVASVAWGAVSDVFAKSTGTGSSRFGALAGLEASRVRLAIDGQPREGWRAWAEAVWRVGAYVADFRGSGAIEYSYWISVQRYRLHRGTRIENGCVLLTTDAWWTEVVPVGRSTREVPIHVQIRIEAVERDGKTLLAGTATGRANLSSFRCKLVRRIAERQAGQQLGAGLRDALAEIEQRGRLAYASGADIADVLDGFKFGIEIGRLRR